MPMPLWFGHVNKRVFNKRELNKGVLAVGTTEVVDRRGPVKG